MVILWGLYGPANIPLGTWRVLHVPGYLVWVALLYAGAGTWLTTKIGRPLSAPKLPTAMVRSGLPFHLGALA
jgi:vitamin B12/bleomycin/antimicrobial peptide transport system ATP-binding/permease protein